MSDALWDSLTTPRCRDLVDAMRAVDRLAVTLRAEREAKRQAEALRVPVITQRPLTRPYYDNALLQSQAQWIARNDTELKRWYAELGGGDDFEDFAASQYDVAMLQTQLEIERRLEPRARSWDEVAADDAGQPLSGPL